MNTEPRLCTRCVMDTSDPDITFDEAGICNHCHAWDREAARHAGSPEARRQALLALTDRLRRNGRGRAYDCVIGVSGGVDSTYVAKIVKDLGLRPLAIHLDNGWDSELAVANIERALECLTIDLKTVVLDWEVFSDLQRSFLLAGTPDCEIPSDHAIVAVLFHQARRLGVPILAGYNHRSESHLPRAWSQGHFDWRYIRAVHASHGRLPLTGFPHLGFLDAFRFFRRLINILDHLDYDKAQARAILERELGWQDYGGKHFESLYTRFYQGYLLPKKFGFDKRRSHLSSLICSGQLGREEALSTLLQPPYDPGLQEQDRIYVAKKLKLTPEQFDAIMSGPPRRFNDFPSYERLRRGAPYRLVRYGYRRLRALGRST